MGLSHRQRGDTVSNAPPQDGAWLRVVRPRHGHLSGWRSLSLRLPKGDDLSQTLARSPANTAACLCTCACHVHLGRQHLGLVPMPRGMPDPIPRQTALGTRCPTRSSSTGAASTVASPSSAPTASASRGTTEAEAPPSTRALRGAFTLAAAGRCILPGPSPLQLDHQRAGRLANRVQRGAALVGYSCGDKRTD